MVSDTALFDDTPADDVDGNGKAIDTLNFDVPESSSIGLVQMSWQAISGTATNENMGIGFAVIDLTDGSSSGAITFSRSATPDLVAWQAVPLGTTMFGAISDGVPLFQSNKESGAFTDDYAETARFELIDNPDGTQTLQFTAASSIGTQSFRDYIGSFQVAWLGSEPFSVSGVPANGTLSAGSPLGGGDWEIDFGDIESLSIAAEANASGELLLDLILASTGEVESIVVHVQPVVDDPSLSASDVVGYVDNAAALGISIGDSVDLDSSETQLQSLSLSGVPASVTLSATAGTVTNFGGGNWQVNPAALATLSATGTTAITANVTVSGINTDTDDLDGDSVIEDGNNGSGADELDSAVYQDTFDITIRAVPTVTSQISTNGTPVISGTADIGSGETLSVSVNGITYTAGDGNLVNNGDGTWELTVPSTNTIADGTYAVTASLTQGNGNIGSDTMTDEAYCRFHPTGNTNCQRTGQQ